MQCQNIQAAYDPNIKNFLACQTTENILKLLLENAIEHSYLAGIHSAILGFGVRSLQDIFLHLYQSYGRIIPAALQVNTTRLTTPIASHLPIALIFRQIEECQRFTIAGGTAFTAEQLIKAAETLILATGKYQLAYREWISLPEIQKTFNEFRLRFNNEYMIQNKMQSSTAQQHGFAENVVEEKNLNDAFANFAQASAADRSVFTQLTDTNAYLQQHVANISSNNDELQQKLLVLQNQINMMNLVQNPAIPPGQIQRPHTTGQHPQYPHYPQPPPQVYQPPSMQHSLPPQYPYQQLYAKRGGYRGQCRGDYLPRGAEKGNINNRYNIEDHPNNMVVLVYNLIKHHHSSMSEIVITKNSRAYPQM